MTDTATPVGEVNLTDIRVSPIGGYAAKQCAHRAHNDNDPTLDQSLREPDSAAAAQRAAEGVIFEDDIADVFAQLLDPDMACFVPACDRSLESKRSRENKTMAAMAAGVEFIWNARLPADLEGSRIAEPDALVRIGTKRNSAGNWPYAAIDVKHHRPLTGTTRDRTYPVSELSDPRFEAAVTENIGDGLPHLSDSMQLVHYHRVLEALGHAPDGDETIWGGIVGKTRRVVWRNLAEPAMYLHFDPEEGKKRRMSAIEVYDLEFEFRKDVILRARSRAIDPTLEPLTRPEHKSECGECPWRTVCHDELVEADHVTLTYGITPDRARPHYEMGVTTRLQLASLDHRTATVVDTGVKDLPALIDAARTETDPTTPVDVVVPAGRTAAGRVTKLTAAGVTNAGELAALDDRTAAYSATGIKSLAASIDQARVARAGKIFRRRGVTRLEIPRADVELDVDMENDSADGGLIYLWGTRLAVRPDSGLRIPGASYRPFVTWTIGNDGPASEAAVFSQLWSWISALRAICEQSGLTFRAYCYTGAEDRCFRHLAGRHAGTPGVPTPDAVEEFLASDHWVDLHKVLTEQLLWPTETAGLKDLAKWARFSWRDSDASGDTSVTWYRDATDSVDPDVRDAARRRLLDYNEDDVEATWHLREWLSRLASARDQSDRVPPVSSLDRRFRARRTVRV